MFVYKLNNFLQQKCEINWKLINRYYIHIVYYIFIHFLFVITNFVRFAHFYSSFKHNESLWVAIGTHYISQKKIVTFEKTKFKWAFHFVWLIKIKSEDHAKNSSKLIFSFTKEEIDSQFSLHQLIQVLCHSIEAGWWKRTRRLTN